MWTDEGGVQQSKWLSVEMVKSTPDESYHMVDFADNLSNTSMLPGCEISVEDYAQILFSGVVLLYRYCRRVFTWHGVIWVELSLAIGHVLAFTGVEDYSSQFVKLVWSSPPLDKIGSYFPCSWAVSIIYVFCAIGQSLQIAMDFAYQNLDSKLPKFEGLERGGFGVEIKSGQHVRTDHGEFVEMKDGQTYGLRLLNMTDYKCACDVTIDGKDQGEFVLILFYLVILFRFSTSKHFYILFYSILCPKSITVVFWSMGMSASEWQQYDYTYVNEMEMKK